LMSQDDESIVIPHLAGPGPSSRTPPFEAQQSMSSHRSDHAGLDPVAASMERNRVLLQRMREQQEIAQREVWSETNLTPEEQTALDERREQQRKQEEEGENELRRVIAESQALAQRRAESLIDYNKSADNLLVPEHTFRNSYDDEDVELQAALKASLEQAGSSKPLDSSSGVDDVESVMSDSTSTAADAPEAAAPSLDEVRRRRLAKFGL